LRDLHGASGKKANNINLVTAGHYLPIVIESIKRARKSGLTIPIVYNSSGYEKVEAIEALDGIVDIFCRILSI